MKAKPEGQKVENRVMTPIILLPAVVLGKSHGTSVILNKGVILRRKNVSSVEFLCQT